MGENAENSHRIIERPVDFYKGVKELRKAINTLHEEIIEVSDYCDFYDLPITEKFLRLRMLVKEHYHELLGPIIDLWTLIGCRDKAESAKKILDLME